MASVHSPPSPGPPGPHHVHLSASPVQEDPSLESEPWSVFRAKAQGCPPPPSLQGGVSCGIFHVAWGGGCLFGSLHPACLLCAPLVFSPLDLQWRAKFLLSVGCVERPWQVAAPLGEGRALLCPESWEREAPAGGPQQGTSRPAPGPSVSTAAPAPAVAVQLWEGSIQVASSRDPPLLDLGLHGPLAC